MVGNEFNKPNLTLLGLLALSKLGLAEFKIAQFEGSQKKVRTSYYNCMLALSIYLLFKLIEERRILAKLFCTQKLS